MRLNRILLNAAICAALASAPALLRAQSSTINTFSPYSFYGIGDIPTQGTTAMRGMAGTGVAFRSWTEINFLNPASYGSFNRRSALLSVGGYGKNYYLSQISESGEKLRSSYNTFNINDISFAIPLGKGLGFGFNVSPYSNVGYRVNIEDDGYISRPDIGHVSYLYEGSGGITQFKGGVGWKVFDKLSVGADLIYLHGNIKRTFTQVITAITGDGYYQPTQGYKNEQINTLLGLFGLQYDIISKSDMLFTFGATYQLGRAVNGRVTNYIAYVPGFYTGGAWADSSRFEEKDPDYSLPHIVTAGLFLQRPKWGVGTDYTYSMWGSINPTEYVNSVSFRNTHAITVGGMYTPNPGDVRRTLNRWTYRAGLRYSNYYMTLLGENINEAAVTFGIGIPLNSAGVNRIDLGLELGSRGPRNSKVIQENYLKFSIGLSLFGEDFWFVKYKYD